MLGGLAFFTMALLRPLSLCPIKPLRLFRLTQFGGQPHGVPVSDKRIKLLRQVVCSKVWQHKCFHYGLHFLQNGSVICTICYFKPNMLLLRFGQQEANAFLCQAIVYARKIRQGLPDFLEPRVVL